MKRNGCLSIVLVCIILLFTGCFGENSNGDKAEGSNKIKLYLMSYTKQFMIQVEKEFTARYPEHSLDIKYFDNRDEYTKKLNTELMAGRGPDVVLFDSYTFDSIYKIMKSGIFCDINPYIVADKSFDMGSYNEKVIDCGVFIGKRYIIPLEYYVEGFITSEELLHKNGISTDRQKWDVKQLADIMEAFMKNKNSQQEFFLGIQSSFSDYVISSGLNYIDYENSKIYFNTPEFRDLLNKYKNIFLKASASDNAREKYDYKYWEILKGNTAIAVSEVRRIQAVWLANSFINSIFKNKGRVYSLPPYDKTGGYTAMPYDMAAINSNSNNKEIAFDIIKFMLSMDLQMDSAFIPVNEEAYDEQMRKYTGAEGENQSISIKGTQLNTIAISEELAEDLRNIKANLTRCVIPDRYINKLMNEAAKKYADGEYSEDQVIEELENKVMLYLNE